MNKSLNKSRIDKNPIYFLLAGISTITYILLFFLSFILQVLDFELKLSGLIVIFSQISIIIVFIGFIKLGKKYDNPQLKITSIGLIIIFATFFLIAAISTPYALKISERLDQIEEEVRNTPIPQGTVSYTLDNGTIIEQDTPTTMSYRSIEIYKNTIEKEKKFKLLLPLIIFLSITYFFILITGLLFSISLMRIKNLKLARKIGKLIIIFLILPITFFIPGINKFSQFIISFMIGISILIVGEIATLFFRESVK